MKSVIAVAMALVTLGLLVASFHHRTPIVEPAGLEHPAKQVVPYSANPWMGQCCGQEAR